MDNSSMLNSLRVGGKATILATGRWGVVVIVPWLVTGILERFGSFFFDDVETAISNNHDVAWVAVFKVLENRSSWNPDEFDSLEWKVFLFILFLCP